MVIDIEPIEGTPRCREEGPVAGLEVRNQRSNMTGSVHGPKSIRLLMAGGGPVLDLCCGPGRHPAALAKRGFTVTAVDRTAFLLGLARARAADASHRIYSGQEMKDLLTKAGLPGARLYGDLDGSSYDYDAQRLIAVARR